MNMEIETPQLKDFNVSVKELKDKLKSVYENMELRVREKEQMKAGAGLV